jgi:hypothetical protein
MEEITSFPIEFALGSFVYCSLEIYVTVLSFICRMQYWKCPRIFVSERQPRLWRANRHYAGNCIWTTAF